MKNYNTSMKLKNCNCSCHHRVNRNVIGSTPHSHIRWWDMWWVILGRLRLCFSRAGLWLRKRGEDQIAFWSKNNLLCVQDRVHDFVHNLQQSTLLEVKGVYRGNRESFSVAIHSQKTSNIVIDPRNPNYFAVRDSDEYARVYDTRKYQLDARPVNTFCPRHLIETHDVHITGLAYSHSSELLVSYNDELIYLFQKNMGIGISPLLIPHEDLQKLEEPLAYEGHRNSHTIKGVSFFGPHDEYVMSGSDCGRVYIYGRRKEPHSFVQ
ncbi:DDB1- and CUL4-associated factor 8 [Camellia lanceoleosa]|uniref:DDB1- and CUL4-associated factor 8 n=1 Tax=Camellia lanceoleosa TaxID=1840588 RepID=A0ACC0G338_9ERIC|nr:DDB1- and CUL4-associated factor 8 [Camellia lanceoleosa]